VPSTSATPDDLFDMDTKDVQKQHREDRKNKKLKNKQKRKEKKKSERGQNLGPSTSTTLVEMNS